MSLSIKIHLVLGVFAVVFNLATGGAYAQGGKKVINAVTITEYPPFEFKDASDKLSGFDIDLLNAMAAKMGAEVNWIVSSFAQLTSFAPIKTKQADVIIAGMTDLPERRIHVNFVNHAYFVQVFFTLRANAERFTNEDAMCGKRLAVPRTSPPSITEAIRKWNEEHCTNAGKPAIVEVPSGGLTDMRLMLMQDRVDAGLGGAASLSSQNTPEGNQFATFGKPMLKAPFGIAFSKDDPQLGEELKKALGAVIADGTYGQLLRKWSIPDLLAIEQPMINGQP